MPSFGIYTNLQKDPDLSIAKTIVEQLKKRGCPCFLEQEVAQMLGMPAISQGCMDILLVLGGDGTMPGSCPQICPNGGIAFRH